METGQEKITGYPAHLNRCGGTGDIEHPGRNTECSTGHLGRERWVEAEGLEAMIVNQPDEGRFAAILLSDGELMWR